MTALNFGFLKFARQKDYNPKGTWRLVMNTMLSANCFPSSLTSKEFRPILALLHFVQECKYFQQHRSQTNQLQTKFEKKRYSRFFLDYLLNLRWKCVLGRHWHWQEVLCPHLLFKAPAIKSIMRVCGFTTLYGDQNIISVCMCLVWAAVHMVFSAWLSKQNGWFERLPSHHQNQR